MTINQEHSEPTIDLPTISQLIPKCKVGDTSARDQLIDEIQDYLSQVANHQIDDRLRKKVGASDIVQNSLLKVVECLEQFKGKTSLELRGWLKQIVIHEIQAKRRYFGTRKRDVSREVEDSNSPSGQLAPLLADGNPTPGTEAIAKERIAAFNEALEKLSSDQAEVIRLRNIDRLSFKEIGQKMNRSEDAVSKLWYRAVLKFEEKLQGLI